MQMHIKKEKTANQIVKNICVLEENHMYVNQILELSMVLDNEHFQKVFASSYNGED